PPRILPTARRRFAPAIPAVDQSTSRFQRKNRTTEAHRARRTQSSQRPKLFSEFSVISAPLWFIFCFLRPAGFLQLSCRPGERVESALRRGQGTGIARGEGIRRRAAGRILERA